MAQAVKDFADKHFGRADKAVSPERIKEDKAYLMKVVRTGIELESARVPESRLQQAFGVDSRDDPSRYSQCNQWVQRVYCDGSISPSGSEIVFKGNSECFDSYHRALKRTEAIIKQFAEGVVNNDSTSSHTTILTSQSRELPDTYIANYYQLYRKFADALLWMASATYQPRDPETRYFSTSADFIVRGGLRQYAPPLMTESPLRRSISEIARSQGSHYHGMFFKSDNQWLENGNPNGFVIEFRFFDRITIPVAMTSLKCLLQALLFKAVELSEFGILNIEAGEGSWEKTKQMLVKITEGQKLSADDKEYLRQKSHLLVNFVYPNLRSFDGKSVSVLRLLADKPISQRYRDGDNDDKIEKDLVPKEKGEFETERELRRIIQLQLVKEPDATKWGKKVASMLGVSDRMVRHTIAKLGDDANLFYDKEVGSYIMVG